MDDDRNPTYHQERLERERAEELYFEAQQLALFSTAPITMLQGQGATTVKKERGFELALRVNYAILGNPSKSFAGLPYFHLDCNAGSGWNEVAQCMGSPLTFVNMMTEGCKPFFAFFAEREMELADQLRNRPQIAQRPSACFVRCADNKQVLGEFAQFIRQHDRRPEIAQGSIIIDPNGYLHPDTVPLDGLQAFCREFPRIDVLANLNVRQLGLERPFLKRGRGKWARPLLEPEDLPTFFSRRHGLISDVRSAGGCRFLMMILRNFRVGGSKSEGFYDLGSPSALRILSNLDGRKVREEDRLYGRCPAVDSHQGTDLAPAESPSYRARGGGCQYRRPASRARCF